MPFGNFYYEFLFGHNFQGIEASNFTLHTQITLRTSAVYKNHNSFPSIFGVIALCKFQLWIFVPGITSKV